MKRYKLQLILIAIGTVLFGISFALTTIDKPKPAAPIWPSYCELVDGYYYVKGSLKKEMCTHGDAAPAVGSTYTMGMYMKALSFLLVFIGLFWLIVGFVATRIQLLFHNKNTKS
ncbi:hypothetical protein EOL73_04150 [Candidatus Saccharibacteria bacterium]|nr:hypothetical protein [Candidatus Saccharibacteria bacterium]NCU40920.1 hypothetical protein [Candidatus Saccharibacteria bacterium]